MEKNDIANFPRPVYSRIPNFKGAQAAAQLFATLPEYQSARTVQVSPDKPQDEVRYLVLDQNKDLIVPTPGLAKGLFNRLTVEPGSTKERVRQLASRQGIDELSKPIPMASRSVVAEYRSRFVSRCVVKDV
jgi:5-formyltetrahydrofolate cyclo-ligase